MTSAVKRFLIFILAILAFAGVRFVSEDWFYFPQALSVGVGLFVAGVIIKPLAAPDLPMSRWLIVPLAGMAVCHVVLTTPRWYERWPAEVDDHLHRPAARWGVSLGADAGCPVFGKMYASRTSNAFSRPSRSPLVSWKT